MKCRQSLNKVPQNALYAPQFRVIFGIWALYVEINDDKEGVDRDIHGKGYGDGGLRTVFFRIPANIP